MCTNDVKLMRHSKFMCRWITMTITLLCSPPALCEEGPGCCLDKSHDMSVKVMHTSYTHEWQGDGRLSTAREHVCHISVCLLFILSLSTSVNVWKKQNKDHWDWPIWKLVFQCITRVAIVILLLSSARAHHHGVFVCLEMTSDCSQGTHSEVQHNQAWGCNLWHIWKDWDMHINNKRAGCESSPRYG